MQALFSFLSRNIDPAAGILYNTGNGNNIIYRPAEQENLIC